MMYDRTDQDIHFVFTNDEARDLCRSLTPLRSGVNDILGSIYLQLRRYYEVPSRLKLTWG